VTGRAGEGTRVVLRFPARHAAKAGAA
jgi:hypothetical protein